MYEFTNINHETGFISQVPGIFACVKRKNKRVHVGIIDIYGNLVVGELATKIPENEIDTFLESKHRQIFGEA